LLSEDVGIAEEGTETREKEADDEGTRASSVVASTPKTEVEDGEGITVGIARVFSTVSNLHLSIYTTAYLVTHLDWLRHDTSISLHTNGATMLVHPDDVFTWNSNVLHISITLNRVEFTACPCCCC